jgi:hypothetical protein
MEEEKTFYRKKNFLETIKRRINEFAKRVCPGLGLCSLVNILDHFAIIFNALKFGPFIC